jgi:hypothetical protein
MLAWLRRRRAATAGRRALVESDAAALIARFGDQAYYVARDRDLDERKGKTVDDNRPVRHWSAVRVKIAKVTGKQVGEDAATRYLENDPSRGGGGS